MKPWFKWNGSADRVIHASKTRLNGILTAFQHEHESFIMFVIEPR